MTVKSKNPKVSSNVWTPEQALNKLFVYPNHKKKRNF